MYACVMIPFGLPVQLILLAGATPTNIRTPRHSVQHAYISIRRAIVIL